MYVMGWSNAAMVKRYAHVTARLRRDVGPFSARVALRDRLPFPIHLKVILTRDGVVLPFVPSFHSVQPCELL